MHILISNDDGIRAPGIHALAEAMLPFGKVTVVAPIDNRSAIGHRKTMHKPLRVDPFPFPVAGVDAYAASDSPSDAVAVALLGLVDEPVDLVVSGINRGANMGQDLTYSGTVSAAFEAIIMHTPAIAFSLLTQRGVVSDFSAAAVVAQRVVEMGVHDALPPLTLLNVNIPALPLDALKGFKLVRQGLRTYHDELISRVDPYGRPYYWLGGNEPSGNMTDEGTDLWATHNGYVSLTPVHLDLTSYAVLQDLAAQDIEATPLTADAAAVDPTRPD